MCLRLLVAFPCIITLHPERFFILIMQDPSLIERKQAIITHLHPVDTNHPRISFPTSNLNSIRNKTFTVLTSFLHSHPHPHLHPYDTSLIERIQATTTHHHPANTNHLRISSRGTKSMKKNSISFIHSPLIKNHYVVVLHKVLLL